jgi:DNA-binding transcriptional regulator YdaS (Cro superfamily)
MKFSEWQKKSGLLKKDIAKELGVSKSLVSLWGLEKRVPSPRLIQEIERLTHNQVRLRDWIG